MPDARYDARSPPIPQPPPSSLLLAAPSAASTSSTSESSPTRARSPSETSSATPVLRAFAAPASGTSHGRPQHLLLPPARPAPHSAPTRRATIARMLAAHVRRGDYLTHCTNLAHGLVVL
ncbi:hypothetical protein DFH06DRAFT_1339315 [Mycena polygramma]|nr:hypothetical protein DFH06DRAFT_1339315 [Mycena polygramma]